MLRMERLQILIPIREQKMLTIKRHSCRNNVNGKSDTSDAKRQRQQNNFYYRKERIKHHYSGLKMERLVSVA